jgi:hypothetical protein
MYFEVWDLQRKWCYTVASCCTLFISELQVSHSLRCNTYTYGKILLKVFTGNVSCRWGPNHGHSQYNPAQRCSSREILMQFLSTDHMKGIDWLLSWTIISSFSYLETVQYSLRAYHVKYNLRHYNKNTASNSVLSSVNNLKRCNDLQLKLI